MEKRVAVQADFTDVLYIERAGLQSAAMGRANSVWCQTTVLHRGATVVGSTAKMPSTGAMINHSFFLDLVYISPSAARLTASSILRLLIVPQFVSLLSPEKLIYSRDNPLENHQAGTQRQRLINGRR